MSNVFSPNTLCLSYHLNYPSSRSLFLTRGPYGVVFRPTQDVTGLFSRRRASLADLTAVSTLPTRSLPPRRACGSASALASSPPSAFSLLRQYRRLLPCHAVAPALPVALSPPALSYPATAHRGSPCRESLHPSAVPAGLVPSSAIPLLPRSGCVAAARAWARKQPHQCDSVPLCS